MQLALYAHPFSSYCQKVLIALYENATPFAFRQLDLQRRRQRGRSFARLWPMERMPVLVDGDARGRRDRASSSSTSTCTIQARCACCPGGPRRGARRAHAWIAFFDNYVMTPMQKIVFERSPAARRCATRTASRRRAALLDTPYRVARRPAGRRDWAAGEAFRLADCAAAPSLFYADWVHPIPRGFQTWRATAPACSRARRMRGP